MLRTIICCEVDPDVLGYRIQATRFDKYKEKLGWKGVDNIPQIREICNSVEDSESNNVKITWHVRSDAQLKTIFDDYAYPLRNFQNLWKELKRQGDEISWHPHLWRWSKQNKCWYQEVSDKKWISHCLENGYKEFLKIAPNLTSIRMGWAFHNNFTMKIINDLGLTVDLSAVPGLRHPGGPDERGSYFLNEYDWSVTPQKPYFPSQQDYRRPAKNNEQSLNILEIPVTTGSKSIGRIFIEETIRLMTFSLQKKTLRTQIPNREQVQYRYVANITKPSFKHLAKQKFKEASKARKTSRNLVALFHPIELFKSKGFLNFENNLKALKTFSESLNVPFSFLTATELAKELLADFKTNVF